MSLYEEQETMEQAQPRQVHIFQVAEAPGLARYRRLLIAADYVFAYFTL